MHSALRDLELEELIVIYAGDTSYQMADRIRAVAFRRLREDIRPLHVYQP
jgi:hypothetical protein